MFKFHACHSFAIFNTYHVNGDLVEIESSTKKLDIQKLLLKFQVQTKMAQKSTGT
jgi:hypothetical protein